MGKVTGISWADSTFNPVIGCTRVSEGCRYCFAERDATRYGLATWGPRAGRQRTSAAYWRQPLRWNEEAREAGRQRRVFCGSMCDVFESHPDVRAMQPDLWALIEATPALTWMLLTKRPENVLGMVPWPEFPEHVWIGASVEDQDTAERRIPVLLQVKASVRFVSIEPMLAAIDLTSWLAGISWYIIGGESGPKARPMQLEWAEDLLAQCREAGVAAWMKQLGGRQDKRTDPAQWPEHLRVQELPA